MTFPFLPLVFYLVAFSLSSVANYYNLNIGSSHLISYFLISILLSYFLYHTLFKWISIFYNTIRLNTIISLTILSLTYLSLKMNLLDLFISMIKELDLHFINIMNCDEINNPDNTPEVLKEKEELSDKEKEKYQKDFLDWYLDNSFRISVCMVTACGLLIVVIYFKDPVTFNAIVSDFTDTIDYIKSFFRSGRGGGRGPGGQPPMPMAF